MQDCQVCGRSFDPFAFQVVVPELARGFDRVECAQSARARKIPGAIAATPLVAIVEPVTAAFAPARVGAPVLRPLGGSIATLGLLAAGTAAAAFLWLRVLAPDATSFPFSRGAAPPALGHEIVKARAQPTSLHASGVRTPSERAAAPSTPAALLVRHPSSRLTTRRTRPLLVAPLSQLRAVSPLTRSAHTTGKGHPKHGKGHYKHGESDGVHSPGHGGGHGHGKTKGKHKHR